MNSQKILRLANIAKQQVARVSTEVAAPPPRIERLKGLQLKLQMDNGEPVHLKSGFRDQVFFQFTTVMVLVGVGLSLQTFYKLTFGKK